MSPLLPETADEWTLAKVIDLLAAHADETDQIEWKSSCADPDRRVAKAAAAMANGSGGFILFGIADDRSRPPGERAHGVALLDFPNTLSQLIKHIDPTPLCRVAHAPIAVSPTHAIYVAQILTSAQAHSVGNVFYKRLPGSSEAMRTSEVRDLFIRREEVRAKVRLLLNELLNIHEAALGVQVFLDTGPSFPLRIVDASSIARLQADLASVLNDDLSRELLGLRARVEGMNFQVESIRSSFTYERHTHEDPKGAAGRLIRLHHQVEHEAQRLAQSLASHLGEPSPRILTKADVRQRAY